VKVTDVFGMSQNGTKFPIAITLLNNREITLECNIRLNIWKTGPSPLLSPSQPPWTQLPILFIGKL